MSGSISAGGNLPARPPAETAGTSSASPDVASRRSPQRLCFAKTLKAKTDTATQRRGGGGFREEPASGSKPPETRRLKHHCGRRATKRAELGRNGAIEIRARTAWGVTSLTAMAGEPRASFQNATTLTAAFASETSNAAERVSEITRRIVEAIELRLGPQGTAAVRMELSLGALGRLRVEIARGEDGKIRLGFESSSERGA